WGRASSRGHNAASDQRIENCSHHRLQGVRGGGRRNIVGWLRASNNGAFLRRLLDLLLLIEGAAKIVDAHHEHDQKRQGDGELQQRRAARFSHSQATKTIKVRLCFEGARLQRLPSKSRDLSG